jgi:voltage-gated potassium channel Kch
LETGNIADKNLWPVFASESLKALLGLGLLSLGGRLFLRRIFEIVANSRSSEAFVAMCLLTVSGTSLLTQRLGFSDTLGAFLAGALLAETNYRTQVEADIRPFRGLLLGLFFVTTGTSIDIQLLLREWPHVLALLVGLIAIKTAIITALGPRAGLTLSESVRTGLLLSQGGEFAFVVFSLANRLGVLPLELNRLLIIVVVLSMGLTPLLNEVGREVAEYIEREFEDPTLTESETSNEKNFQLNEPVVIIGFGQMGQVLANFLSTPLATGLGGDAGGWPYVAFDLDPGRVKAACKLGFPVLYGDGSRPVVLQTAGISSPKAVMVMYTGRQKSVQSVDRLRQAFPHVPIYARAQDLGHLFELKQAGITDCILENAETSLQLGSVLLRGLGVMSDDVRFLRRMMRESMELRAQETVDRKDSRETDWLVAFQAKVRRTWKNRTLKDDSVPRKEDLINEQAYWMDGKTPPSTNEYSLDKEERKLDEKLPLLFSKKKLPASKVRVSASGLVNGAAATVSEEGDGPLSSSAIAVASPSGMLLEQKALKSSPGPSSQAPDDENLTVVQRPEPSSPVQPASVEMAKLKWRQRKAGADEDLDDERGVTMCVLEEDERYRSELEEGEELEKLDESIMALNSRGDVEN